MTHTAVRRAEQCPLSSRLSFCVARISAVVIAGGARRSAAPPPHMEKGGGDRYLHTHRTITDHIIRSMSQSSSPIILLGDVTGGVLLCIPRRDVTPSMGNNLMHLTPKIRQRTRPPHISPHKQTMFLAPPTDTLHTNPSFSWEKKNIQRTLQFLFSIQSICE